MVFSKNMIYLLDTVDIVVPETTLIRLEDGIRQNKEMLLTIDASHYGRRNNNWTWYRHDTVRNDINTFVYPEPKPVIEKHNPKTSKVFGSVIAADYKHTSFYPTLTDSVGVEGLSTEEYIKMCKTRLLPLQKSNPDYTGLAKVQVVVKLNDADGIKRVLEKQFLRVSIGAKPRRLICSECGQDQTVKICEHYGVKHQDWFMLAESLEYEELSFVPKGADPFAKIVRIHDGEQTEVQFEDSPRVLEAQVGAMYLRDFFQETAEDKTIVCMNNICTVINREDNIMSRQKKDTVALQDEFGAEQVKSVTDSLEGTNGDLALPGDLTDRQFALVQKTPDGSKRRFPIHDELNVRVGLQLVDKAEDLTEVEREKVVASLKRAAKKFGIEITDESTEEPAVTTTEETTEETVVAVTDAEPATSVEVKSIELLIEDLRTLLSADEYRTAETLKDYIGEPSSVEDTRTNPVEKIFDLLKWFSNDIKWAGESLNNRMSDYLIETGKSILTNDELKETEEVKVKFADMEHEVVSLKEELALRDEEIALLDRQNTELNYQLRGAMVDEIVATRGALGLLEDSEENEKVKFLKFNYDALVTFVSDTRKLKTKLNDSTVNNTLEITKVSDPTHTDSDDCGSAGLTDGSEEEPSLTETTKELSFKEKVALMKRIARTTRF